jgi:diguanylate cyclase (GGDEF)-like protein
VLRSTCRALDSLARVGGDEFVLILPGLTEDARVSRIADQIVSELKRPIPFHGDLCHIAGSIGYVIVPEGAGAAPAAVLSASDAALYASKQAGRGRAQSARLAPPPVAVPTLGG